MKDVKKNKNIHAIDYPLVTSQPVYAALFTMFSNNEEDLIWFYNHFLQLRINHNKQYVQFNFNLLDTELFKSCPLVEYYFLEYWFFEKMIKTVVPSFDILNKSSSLENEAMLENVRNVFMSYIMDAIDKGFYIYSAIDMYEIPAYDSYFQKKRVMHPVFVYGYDSDTQLVYLADFFNSEYEFTTVTFNEFTRAYFNVLNKLKGDIYFLKKSPRKQVELDIPSVLGILNDYLSGTNTVNLFNDKKRLYSNNAVFGINIYEVLANEFAGMMSLINSHLLYDHKTILLALINQLHKEGRLKNYCHHHAKISQIKDNTFILRNKIIKYMYANKHDYDPIRCLLREIADAERDALKGLLADITLSSHFSDSVYDCSIEYIGIDEITKGVWVGKYGNVGYDIFGYMRKIKDPISIQYFNAINENYSLLGFLKDYIRYHSFSEEGELLSSKELDDIFAPEEKRFIDTIDSKDKCAFSNRFGNDLGPFDIVLKIDTSKPILTSLYFMRDEGTYPSHSIDFIDEKNAEIIYTHEIDENYSSGVYVRLKMMGLIRIRFNKSNAESVPYLSGIFFDEPE